MTPADAAFDQSREIWNRLHDRRPTLVVRPASSADVALAVRFAQEHRMEIAIKGGGHHAAGYASTEGGMLLDMAGLRTIEVFKERSRRTLKWKRNSRSVWRRPTSRRSKPTPLKRAPEGLRSRVGDANKLASNPIDTGGPVSCLSRLPCGEDFVGVW